MNFDMLVETIIKVDEAKKSSKFSNKAKKDRPMDQTKHKLKMARGMDRKHLYQIPKYDRYSSSELKFAKNVVNYAKKAKTGVWKLSPAQIDEITNKYKFNKPSMTKRTKHLGNTDILMWLNPNDGAYYLVKLGKSRGKM
jgi:hypothetical protein